MADEEAPHDWDPEKEKKQTDPEELARSFVRAAAEEQKKIDMEARAEERRQVEAGGLGGGLPMRVYTPPPPDLQMSVHRIKNGLVVTYGQGPHGHPLTIDLAETEYAKDGEAALAIVQRITREFILDSLAPAGTSPGLGPVFPRPQDPFPPIGPG